ncbi:hypothetical protein PIB30_080279 [Stylosanthes scabra]|uniref:Uncharacterized protein n=1 Tax=Stylosanthes scabra TaxID=79078 RepID=A0ABU6XQG2_9FABA|nr:hypothetical protein [Stylosanthes scabra]
MTAPGARPSSINLHGNDTLLTLYYLIRSGALAGGSLRFCKDFGHQVFGAVAGDSLDRQYSGNCRNKQLVEFDPEIERTLTRNRNRVKFQRALQENPSVGNFSEDFTEAFSDSGEEVIQDNMVDREHNDQRRTLRDYITPTTVSCSSSVVRPAVEANNFELKPFLIQLV